MALGDAVLKGKQYKIGFGALSFTGYQVTGAGHHKTAEREAIKGTQNETVAYLYTDPGAHLDLDVMIEDSAGDITPPDIGDFVSVTEPDGVAAVKYEVSDSGNTSHQYGVTTRTLSLERKDSMQTTLDA